MCDAASEEIRGHVLRVKDMGSKQLEEASHHAQAGKGTIKQGDIKLAGDDHQVSIQESFESQADRLMEEAVEKLRRTLAHEEKNGVLLTDHFSQTHSTLEIAWNDFRH